MSILIFLLTVFTLLIVYGVINKKHKTLSKKIPASIKVEKIKMYGRDSCGFTVKMKELIKKEGKSYLFQYIDTSKPEGILKYEKLNVNGVPAFEYRNKVVVGAMSMSELLEKLNIN